MIFNGQHFNLKGPMRTLYGSGLLMVSTELAMSWPAVPCLACFSHFHPTPLSTACRSDSFVRRQGSGGQNLVHCLRDSHYFCPHQHAVEFRQQATYLHAPQRDCEVSWALLLWHTLTWQPPIMAERSYTEIRPIFASYTGAAVAPNGTKTQMHTSGCGWERGLCFRP